jgi:DNA-binding NarL/FixJ family response regulator
VWVVEDSDDYRETVQELIDTADDLACPHAFASGEELLEFLNGHLAPEVILVDIGLPGMSGIEIVERLHGFSPATHLVMLTIHEDNDRIFDAICAGACGYLLKTATPEQILTAVREALEGGAPMTPQIARRVLNLFTQMHAPRWNYDLTKAEQGVLQELVEGKTKSQIAKALFISPHTVDTHLRSIYAKLHVHSAPRAIAKAYKEKLVPPDHG